jgi:peptidyl-Asp metalloendopeptidase
MKLNRIVLGMVFAGLVSTANAAENLFAVAGNRAEFAAPGELLQQVAADPANERIEIVSARADLISDRTQELALNLPGGINVVAKMTRFERMESGNEVWSGQIDLGKKGFDSNDISPLLNNIIAVRSGDTVLANIRLAGQLYRLVPVDKGAHALVEVDQSKFLSDESKEGYAEMVANSNPLDLSKPVTVTAKAISTIRVMVAFGPAATAAIGNEQQAVDLAFSEANTALANTNTDARFQQAGAIQFYTQSETSNYSTMLNRLVSQSDGFYDAIGGQRNTNAGDLVAYFAPSSAGLCGQAATIGATASQAYFVMNPSCISGNYTFVHEAGHLMGARHDNDPTTTPFAYGHGFVISSKNARTVMAVNNGPCASCTRIGAFSSPNYTTGGVPIGTVNINDNTRVWRTRGPTVAAFR